VKGEISFMQTQFLKLSKGKKKIQKKELIKNCELKELSFSLFSLFKNSKKESSICFEEFADCCGIFKRASLEKRIEGKNKTKNFKKKKLILIKKMKLYLNFC
jgi:hypothetical protein